MVAESPFWTAMADGHAHAGATQRTHGADSRRGHQARAVRAARAALHGQGYRFRLHGRGLPGKPDIVFKKRKRAVFVHGCFWHRHGCKRTTHPKSRQDYWQDKFAKNVARDRRNAALLADDGWDVFVAWECEVDSDETLLQRLMEFLGPPRVQ